MSTRGGRGGWSGDKSKRFMMVGTKDPGGGAKTGVVAPVPINTPSLRQEIHGSQGDNTGIASINRASSGGGWGSAVGASSASESNADGHGTAGGKGKGRGDGSSRQGGGDDVFTRHFPDLRAGLEQAEKLDAVTKASSKVAPLRKPKPEPAKSQGPSLRPRAMLKPTGSAGGGSAATAAAQAAIADAVHNRVASAPKPEERRRPVTSFADEISTKSRWTERSQQDGGAKARRGGRGGEGRGFGGSAWETSKEGSRGFGKGGRGFDRGERGGDTFHDKDRRNSRHTADRSTMNNTRGRESIFGTGGHAGAANSSQDSTSSGTKAPTTTYVRQHGPPPRKPAAATPAPKPQHDDSPAIQQPTRSSAYSASARSSDQSREDSWGKVAETSSKWRPAQQSVDTPPEASPTLDSPSTQSVSYVRTYGPPRGSGRETQADEHSATSAAFSRQENDSGGEATSRFGSSWGTSEQSRGGADRESSGGAERTVSGRWKEPTSSLAPPPPPTNTRWKEPKEEPKTGARRWKAKEEGQTGSGGWGRSAEEDGDVDGGGAAAAALIPSPSQNSSWKESSSDGWGLEVGKRVEEMPTTSSTPDNVEDSVSIAAAIGANGGISGDKSVEVSGAEEPVGTPAQDIPTEDESTFRGSFTQQQQSQPVIRTASWEPQLPRGGGGGDLWDTQGHGRDSHPQQPGSGQGGPSTSGGASRPWSDPWGTSGFGLSASGDQGSGSMASFLDNDEPRKERYLPPALRNRTPSQGNQEDAANVPSVDDATETISSSLPDVASTDVSAQDLVIPGGGGIGASPPDGTMAAKGSLYEQQEQEQRQQQAPLQDWQQGGAQASHQLQQDQAGRPVEEQLHQQHPVHPSHQGQPAQPLHLHDHAHLDRGFQRNTAESFSSFQPQDRQNHQLQEPGLHQFQPEQFQAQVYHNQQQAGQAPLPEHLHRPPYQSDHISVQRQQFQVQIPQQIQAPQQRARHSLHQPYQQPPQRPQQHGQHPHPQGYQQGHQPLDMSRQTSQAHQQMHLQQQHQHQQMQHPSSAFMMPSQGMGYTDPRAARGGGLGGLPVHMASSNIYGDVPPPTQQQGGMPPSGVYGFQSQDNKR